MLRLYLEKKKKNIYKERAFLCMCGHEMNSYNMFIYYEYFNFISHEQIISENDELFLFLLDYLCGK